MKFPLVAGVDAFTILVDNDEPDRNGRRAGPAAAAECSQRWTDAGREVFRIVPKKPGADMADLIIGKARKAFNRAVKEAQARELIGARELGGITYAWLAAQEKPDEAASTS